MLDKIEELAKKEPFTPYRLLLTNGSSYDVLSPLMVAVGQTQIAYFYPKTDRIAYLRINQLAAIETLEPHDV